MQFVKLGQTERIQDQLLANQFLSRSNQFVHVVGNAIHLKERGGVGDYQRKLERSHCEKLGGGSERSIPCFQRFVKGGWQIYLSRGAVAPSPPGGGHHHPLLREG